MAALALYAGAVLVVVWRPTRPAALDIVLPVVDIGFAVALGLASGGVFSLLFLVFLFAPATTAFQLRPRLTLAVTVLSVGAYLVHALAHPSSSRSGAVDVAFARALYLAWIGAVLVGLSTLLARRERRLADLLQSRKRLVQETLHADERARARLAGDLHDGVLQGVLAVRYAVEEAAERDPALQTSADALTDIAAEMRGVIGELHPRVLEHVGLQAALGAVVRRAASGRRRSRSGSTSRAPTPAAATGTASCSGRPRSSSATPSRTPAPRTSTSRCTVAPSGTSWWWPTMAGGSIPACWPSGCGRATSACSRCRSASRAWAER